MQAKQVPGEGENESLERSFPEPEPPEGGAPVSGERVIIYAPTGRDGRLTCEILERAALDCVNCASLDAFCRELRRGTGVAVLAEEALHSTAASQILRTLDAQPPWSDLPLVVFNGVTSAPDPVLEALRTRGNITLLDRPVRIATLVSAVQSALRARRRQYEVRDLLLRLERDARRKDEFLAMLGHELRNPLAAASNALEVLKCSRDSEERAARQVTVLDRQIHNLCRMVDDLLDVSRVSMGKIHLRRERLDLRSVVRHACESVRASIRERGHTLALEVGEAAIPVEGDPLRLEQIVTNLLTNAIRYTPTGGQIRVAVGEEGGEGVVRVKDNGMGIPREMLTHIFELFTQAHTSDERTGGGLGLGLTLVRGLVALHGGRITAFSEGAGRGTEFVVCFPSARAHAETEGEGPDTEGVPLARPGPQAVEMAPAGGGRRVLVVEDNPDGRESMQDLLEIWGYEVDVAADGERGVERAIAFRPEVALVDIGLPGIDGYQAAQLIRRALDGHCPRLIAMTGYGQPEDRERAEKAGFDAYVVKPVDPAELSKLLMPERGTERG